MSSSLNCKACNEFGCNLIGEKAYVLDMQFISHISSNKIVEGDNITLECVALKSYASSLWIGQPSIRGQSIYNSFN